MFKINPYNTTPGKVFDTKKIKQKINELLVINSTSTLFSNIVMPVPTYFISGILPGEKDLPILAMPMITTDTRGKDWIVVDIRGVLKSKLTREDIMSAPSIKDILRNETEYTFIILRASIMGHYLNKDEMSINNIKDDLANAFGSWISTSTLNTYALTVEEVILLRIVLMYYYYSIMQSTEINLSNVKRIVVSIGKYFGSSVASSYIEDVLEPITKEDSLMNPSTLEDLVKLIKLIFEPHSDKLKNMTSLSLLQMILNTWFGDNSNEIIAVSLEHPPTFAAVCYLALSSNSFRYTKLSSILDSKLKNKKDLLLNLNIILKNSNYKV